MPGNVQNIGISQFTPGYNGLIFGPIKIGYGPKGNTTRFKVTSATIAPLINYYNFIVTFGASGEFSGCDVGVDGLAGAEEKSLTVELPGLVNSLGVELSELFFDQWELLTNENTDTIFADPLIVASTPASFNGRSSPILNVNDKDVLSQLALNGGTLTQAIAQADTNVPANAPHALPTAPAALQLVLEILKGQTEFGRPTQVLRHTSYKSASSTYNSNRDFDMYIYSTAQLLSEVGSGWTYNLPPDLYSQISSFSASHFESAPLTEAPYYTWGWLKKISRQPVLANFMVEVSVEYELNLWSNLRYLLR